MREHEARRAVGERRLADALAADDEEGVRHAPAAVGGEENVFCAGMTEQRGRRARMRRFGALARLRTHDATLARAARAVAGLSFESTASHTRLATSSLAALALMMTQRSGDSSASVK